MSTYRNLIMTYILRTAWVYFFSHWKWKKKMKVSTTRNNQTSKKTCILSCGRRAALPSKPGCTKPEIDRGKGPIKSLRSIITQRYDFDGHTWSSIIRCTIHRTGELWVWWVYSSYSRTQTVGTIPENDQRRSVHPRSERRSRNNNIKQNHHFKTKSMTPSSRLKSTTSHCFNWIIAIFSST